MIGVRLALPAVLVTLALGIACGDDDGGPSATQPAADGPLAQFSMQSNAFQNEGDIPSRYTCDGQDVSPPLFWEEPPEGTQSFVLFMDDPDAPGGTFNHWLYYDLPGETRSLPEGVPVAGEPPPGGFQGTNSFGDNGYGGPCPPSGQEHAYIFTLTALDSELDMASGASKDEVLAAMQGRALGEARLTGNYGR